MRGVHLSKAKPCAVCQVQTTSTGFECAEDACLTPLAAGIATTDCAEDACLASIAARAATSTEGAAIEQPAPPC